MLFCVLIGRSIICSSRIQSWIANAFVSIWRVRRVGCSAFAMNNAPWLSMNNVVGWYCGKPNSCSIERRYSIVFPASAAAVNSASVEDSATVAWYFDLYAITPPANICAMPVTDRQCALSLPQSESTYECILVISVLSGNVESRLLFVIGCSCSMCGSDRIGRFRQ